MKTAAVFEKSIHELSHMLQTGETTSVAIVEACLRRIAAYDRHGPLLNSVVVLNPAAFEEAQASDRRRAEGRALGVLDGVPFTLKAMYAAKGLPVSGGSPAFKGVIAREDSWAAASLRAAGAVLIGLTNTPPLADGGMQRGLYGRAESPYNENFLPAAYQSGSSNGAGVSTASSFAAFGLGTETWSSGRTPASNNGLAAYTPSRGLISCRGVWPLVPTMDVVVPMARTVEDLEAVSVVLAQPDSRVDGDFWREQQAAEFPSSEPLQPQQEADLSELRVAVPEIFTGETIDEQHPLNLRGSVTEIFTTFLEAFGPHCAAVERTDLPVLEHYPVPNAKEFTERGIVPTAFLDDERRGLMTYAWDHFLKLNDDAGINRLADADESRVFPPPPDSVKFSDQTDVEIEDYVRWAREHVPSLDEISQLGDGLRGLEETRRIDFEDWLSAGGWDIIILPTVSNIGPFDADFNPESNRIAMSNGTWVGNGNLIFRHLGIPTVTVPLGMLHDIGMPIGVTIAGPAGSDGRLFAIARSIERVIGSLGGLFGRTPPRRLPQHDLPDGVSASAGPADSVSGATSGAEAAPAGTGIAQLSVQAGPTSDTGGTPILVRGRLSEPAAGELRVTVNGRIVPAGWEADGSFAATCEVDSRELYRFHSLWRGPYGAVVTAMVELSDGRTFGGWRQTGSVE